MGMGSKERAKRFVYLQISRRPACGKLEIVL